MNLFLVVLLLPLIVCDQPGSANDRVLVFGKIEKFELSLLENLHVKACLKIAHSKDYCTSVQVNNGEFVLSLPMLNTMDDYIVFQVGNLYTEWEYTVSKNSYFEKLQTINVTLTSAGGEGSVQRRDSIVSLASIFLWPHVYKLAEKFSLPPLPLIPSTFEVITIIILPIICLILTLFVGTVVHLKMGAANKVPDCVELQLEVKPDGSSYYEQFLVKTGTNIHLTPNALGGFLTRTRQKVCKVTLK